MWQDPFRPRFLGQVRLAQTEKMMPYPHPSPPSPAEPAIDPTGRSLFPQQYRQLVPPNPSCLYLGLDNDPMLEAQKAKAANYGYTDIQATSLPPCPPPDPNATGWAALIPFMTPWCDGIVSYTADRPTPPKPTGAVWACPGPDQANIEKKRREDATAGCEKLFTEARIYGQESIEQQARIKQEKASGRIVRRVITGKVTNPTTKSEEWETEVWSCPPKLQAIETPPQAPPGAMPSMPVAPVEPPKADLLPVAAGAGVVALLAAVGASLFGGK